MEKVTNFIDAAIKLGVSVQKVSGPKLVGFKRVVVEEQFSGQIQELRNQVEVFAMDFRLPGHEDI